MYSEATVVPVTPRKRRKKTCKPQDILVKSPYFSPSKPRNDILIQDVHRRNSDESRGDPTGQSASLSNDSSSLVACQSSKRSSISKPSEDSHKLTVVLSGLKPRLIQEQVAEDVWKVLVAVTLLNKTNGRLAIPTFWNIITKWPTPLDLSQAPEEELTSILRPLGTYRIRSKRLIGLSRAYIQDPPSALDIRTSRSATANFPAGRNSPYFLQQERSLVRYPGTPISHIPGAGPYALDSYRIFCTVREDPSSEEWKTVMPTDKELIRYLKWKWAYDENMEWSPIKGVKGPATTRYLSRLVLDLSKSVP